MSDADAPEILGLPFDLHERYALTRRLVRLLWPERSAPLRLLDVGGHSSPLKQVLPNDTVVLTDPKPPGSLTGLELRFDSYVQGDGLTLPFAERSFDLVTAHDTLEHVPALLRPAFLEELLRVTRTFLILNGPVYEPRTALAESVIARLQEQLSLGENLFLHEHRRFGLPEREAIERALASRRVEHVSIPNGRLSLWVAGNAAKDLANALFPSGQLAEIVDQALNSAESFRQPCGLGYRMAYVVAAGPEGSTALERIREAFPLSEEDDEEVMDRTLALLENFVRETPMAAAAARQRELETKLAELQAAHDRVTSTAGYRLLQQLHRAFDRVAPWGTRRRSFLLAPTRAVRIGLRQGWGTLLRKATRVWRWAPGLWARAVPPLERLSWDERYDLWLRLTVLSPRRMRRMRTEARTLPYRPLISVIVPVYDPEPRWLRAAIESVRAQAYGNWELCLVDDGSTREEVRQLLTDFARRDQRIKVRFGDRNRGISEASNAALDMATGEFVGFLDHDDELKPNALFEVAKLLNRHRDIDYVYSDEDKVDLDGWVTDPFFKPDWSPELLMSVNYVTHFSVYRAELVRSLGGLRSRYDGSQDYDLALRVTEATKKIAHIPVPLYSWRKVPGSAATSLDFKAYAFEAGTRALEDALDRRGSPGVVEHGLIEGRYRVRYEIRGHPRVVVVIPTRDRVDLLERCVDSIRNRSTYDRYELFVIDNGSREPRTFDYLATFPGRVMRYPHEFNFSTMMNAALEEIGDTDFVLLLNNDTEVIAPEWLDSMVEHGQREEVAAVGARLLFRTGTPQHEGIVVGLGGSPARNVAHDYFGLGQTVRNCSAVSAACMLTRPEVFRGLGGFDERLSVAWGDVDFCLRAREKGYEIVYTPYALLYHDEGSTRGVGGMHGPEDDELFLARWGGYRDPYYSPCFDPDTPFELALRG
jgi:GT2 family glycosyltransferase